MCLHWVPITFYTQRVLSKCFQSRIDHLGNRCKNGAFLGFCVFIENNGEEALRRGCLPLCACSDFYRVTVPSVRKHSDSEVEGALSGFYYTSGAGCM